MHTHSLSLFLPLQERSNRLCCLQTDRILFLLLSTPSLISPFPRLHPRHPLGPRLCGLQRCHGAHLPQHPSLTHTHSLTHTLSLRLHPRHRLGPPLCGLQRCHGAHLPQHPSLTHTLSHTHSFSQASSTAPAGASALWPPTLSWCSPASECSPPSPFCAPSRQTVCCCTGRQGEAMGGWGGRGGGGEKSEVSRQKGERG
jgi:hypothetical protein